MEPEEREGLIKSIVERVKSELQATKGRIINVTMTTEDKEYTINLPPGCKKFSLKMRQTDTAFRWALEKERVANTSASTAEYSTIPAAGSHSEDLLNLERAKIYVACGTAGKTIECVAWR